MSASSEKEIMGSQAWRDTQSSTPDHLRKNQTAVAEKEVDADTDSQTAHWVTGVKNRFPWLGFGCLIFILICIGFVITVGKTSDYKLQEKWPAEITWERVNDQWKTRLQLKPSVALAALNTASNLALVIAIGNGVAISWWRRCLHGATVDQLHSSWSFSTSTLELLTAGKKFNLIALAAITTKISLVDNILLQRAVSTEASQYYTEGVKISLPSVSELPAGYAGNFNNSDLTSEFASYRFAKDLGAYTVASSNRVLDQDMGYDWSSVKTGCYGECYGDMPGFGFNVTCSDIITQPRALLTPQSANNSTNTQSAYWEYQNASSTDSIDTILASDITYIPANQDISWFIDNGKTLTNRTFPTDTIQINTAWAELTDSSGNPNNQHAQTCSAVMSYRQCILQPAHVTYNVDLVDTRDRPEWIPEPKTVVAHAAVDGFSMATPASLFSQATINDGQVAGSGVKVVAPAYQPWSDKYSSNIGVIATQMSLLFQTFVSLSYNNNTGYIPSALGNGIMNGWYTAYSAQIVDPTSCTISPKDPMQYIVSQINIIMMRASVSAAFTGGNDFSGILATPSASTSFLADTQSPSVVYITAWPFLWAACAVMLLCVLCVLPTYWGFWELGRKVTLGPMEIASAFQAPVLQHGSAGTPGGGEVKALLAVVGDRKVAYGQTEDGKLAVAGADEVNKLPQSGPTLKIGGVTL